jgi:lysophospholipase L1-like esterase
MTFTMFTPALSLATLVSVTLAAPYNARADLPPFFLLAGDSTTHSTQGWGDGFINTTILSPAKGINYGHSGATIPSFKSGGDWATVLSQVKKYKSKYAVMVTIQFGHNDQKSADTEDAFSDNLKGLVQDVNSAGGTPVGSPNQN